MGFVYSLTREMPNNAFLAVAKLQLSGGAAGPEFMPPFCLDRGKPVQAIRPVQHMDQAARQNALFSHNLAHFRIV